METGRWSWFILASCVIALLLYKYLKNLFDYWRIRGVPYLKSNWLLGSMYDVLIGRKPMALLQFYLYRKLAPHRYGGYFQFQTPILLIRDPEIIKKILTKDFHHFHDRGMKFHPEVEPLSRQLFFMNGEEWKNLRIKLTPTFSSGKMKVMMPLIEECARELVSVLLDDRHNPDIDIKDLLCRYTGDAIASCAFGLNIGILKNPNSEFYLKSKEIFKFRYRSLIRFVYPKISPLLIKWFQLTFFPRKVTDFYTAVVKDMLEYREQNKIVRNDFFNLLINLKNNFDLNEGRKEHEEIDRLQQLLLDDSGKTTANIDMNLDMIASQCFLFLGAAFEMTANMMSFLLFEIARHRDVQENLKNEIDTVLEKYDQQLTYYALKDMKYLDMVLAETLRMYPGAPVLMRSCTADYKVEDSDLVIAKGTQVVISVMGLHYDKQYYLNPEEFNPANFDEDTKQHRPQYTYLPFGEGPRVCIAERFAKLQIKIAAVHLIKNFEFRVSPKMKLPVEFENNLGFLVVKGGIRIQHYPRK